MKFARHAWGVFTRGRDPAFKGRGPEILLSSHKTQVVAEGRAAAKFLAYARRLTKAERKKR